MDNVTLDRFWNDPAVKVEIDAAARRERARVLKRFLEQAAQALLGSRPDAHRLTPCEAC